MFRWMYGKTRWVGLEMKILKRGSWGSTYSRKDGGKQAQMVCAYREKTSRFGSKQSRLDERQSNHQRQRKTQKNYKRNYQERRGD